MNDSMRFNVEMVTPDWFMVEVADDERFHWDLPFTRQEHVVYGRAETPLRAPEVHDYIEANIRGKWAYSMATRNGAALNGNPVLRLKVIVHEFYFESKEDAAIFKLAFG